MKKAFGLILCMVIIIAAAIPAFAIVRAASAELVSGKLNIVIDGGIDKVEAYAKDEVSVKIKFKNNSTISSAKIILTYDKQLSVVTKKDKSGNDVPDVTFDIYDSADSSAMYGSKLYAEDNKLLLNWLTAVGEVKGDVTYATVKFKVAADAKVDSVLSISAEIDPDDVYDIDVNNVDYALISGGITVIEKPVESGPDDPVVSDEPDSETDKPDEPPVDDRIKGDINGDEEVNNKDVVLLFRYVSSNGEYDEIYDYNEDGNVDNKDVVMLFRYVSSK